MGYASQQFLPYDSSTLALFKAWAQAISLALGASGWAQTSDTGQVNWSTISSVPSPGSYVYEIWHPTDALQTGSTQYFFKIEYGAGSGSPHGPAMRLSLGTGTNGSGTLTGTLSVVYVPMGTGAAAPTSPSAGMLADCYFSGDVDRFSFMLWRGFGNTVTVLPVNTSVVFAFGIERTKNYDGTNSSDGVTYCCWNSTNQTRGQQTIVFAASAVASPCNIAPDNPSVCLNGYGGGSGTNLAYFNNNTPLFMQVPVYGKPGNPMTIFGIIAITDIAECAVVQCTLYGATRTFICTHQFLSDMSSGNMVGNFRLAMRFD